MDKNVFEISVKGRRAITFPDLDVEESEVPSWIKREDEIGLPSLSELDVIRHFTKLSQKNFSVDTHFYPLGSCTMKYNPKINETTSSYEGFLNIHPYQDVKQVQGALEVIYELEQALGDLTGLPYVSLAPNAGAQGEFVGIKMIHKYFDKKGENRKLAIIPDSAHGTNPASAVMAGYQTIQVKSNANGTVDMDHFKKILTPEVACIMLTNPNTLGLFENDICEMSELLKKNGSLLYSDGANFNAIIGKVKPGDIGVDVLHLNLHKTFSTPHGGGGPGSGPVCVSDTLKEFLPTPRVLKNPNSDVPFQLQTDGLENSIGRIRWFYGNFLVFLRAYTYILSLGKDGVKKISSMAVLNANYMKSKLDKLFPVPYNNHCMHEFVMSLKELKQSTGVSAMDVAKRLIDYGFHPPTMYFPLIVPEAMMVEPTETESKETLDAFIAAMEAINEEIKTDKEKVKSAPFNMPVGRLNEVKAVKDPKLII